MGILREFDVNHRRTLAPLALPVFMNYFLRPSLVRSCIFLVASLTMTACATNEKNQGPDEYYRSSGWSDLKEELPADSFRDYRASVTRRVQRHRFIIGIDGDYRNCGGTGGRGPEAVMRCESAATGDFDFVTWRNPDKPDGRPSARSAFNPQFDNMVGALADFLGEVTNE